MGNKERDSLRRLVQASMLAAMACAATLVIQIPSPMNGYVNLGDAVVLLSGWLLGPWYGFAAAAGIPGNVVQACFGLAAGVLLAAALDRAGVRPAGGGTERKI